MEDEITCPFCGKKVTISTVDGKYPLYYIRCSDCRWMMQDYNKIMLIERATKRPVEKNTP